MNKNSPLITIVVITYNSEKFVIETLESIKKQTYKNIELIITDDCSSDSTVKICKEWIEKEKCRFVNTKLITSDINTGISANCNRGYFAANGVWIKGIAGDDALLPDCIEKYMNFISEHKEARICHAKAYSYKIFFREDCKIKYNKRNFTFPLTIIPPSAHAQLLQLGLYNPINAVTVIIERNLFIEIGGFDEKIRNHEDYPMWIKITKLGYAFYFMNEFVANYRVHSASVIGSAFKNKILGFYKENNIVYKLYLKKNTPLYIRFVNRYQYYVIKIFDSVGLTKNTAINRIIIKFFMLPYNFSRKIILIRLRNK